jgi:NAD(P)-dependent dehydrogenase (short-subunit alcohol dehydrogenase family)
MNQLDLKNRHAVITGGAAGIGLAIAQRMLVSGGSRCGTGTMRRCKKPKTC